MNGISRLGKFVSAIGTRCAAILCLFVFLSSSALAAGAVEMQVEHIVVQTIDAYNQAMEANDPAGWVKYFTDNVRRHSPLSDQQGKKDFADYSAWEFSNFQAKYVTKKILVSGRSAAVVIVWDAVHKPTATPLQVEMVGIFELASSGRFESVSFYYDTAKAAKLLTENTAAK
jgi:predicted SnoaL-like aldol condensation-catalyzing enzyme